MALNKKKLQNISLLYGIIISILNYIGYLLPSTGKFPVIETEGVLVWFDFMNTHRPLVTALAFVGFGLPISMCVYYSRSPKNEVQIHERLINLPLVYSLIGASGWIISYFFELAVMIYIILTRKVLLTQMMISSVMNITQASIFIFTLCFLVLDTIQRKIILPKYFPEGNISRFKNVLKPSVNILFTIFYLSVGIFPIFYMFSVLLKYSVTNNFSIEKNVYMVILFIISLGIIIVVTFEHYFSSPLKEMKRGAEKVKEGDYNSRVKIVSNDDFGELADTFNDMTSSLSEKTRKILAIQDSVIKGMAVMVESRDNSTGGHINRTSDCVRVFVGKLKQTEEFKSLSPKFCESVIKAAPMHDLGKIAVDDAILRKPGKFTDEEYEIMKKHSAEGARIVENVLHEVDDEDFKKIAVNVAHFHHEKWNGTGYPEKIGAEHIPLEARIMALADVFDALVSKRCYKDSMSYDKAFQIIEESAGTHFDPVLARMFIECRPELEALYNNY